MEAFQVENPEDHNILFPKLEEILCDVNSDIKLEDIKSLAHELDKPEVPVKNELDIKIEDEELISESEYQIDM